MNDDEFQVAEAAMREHGDESVDARRSPAPAGARVVAGVRPFIAAQFMVAVGSVDAEGAAWASLLFGKPGFVRSGDGAAIQIDTPLKERDLADPVWDNIAPGAELGLLFIDLATRQRCRVNGAVQRLDRRGTEIAVRDVGPHCPRHGAQHVLRQLGEPRLPVQTAHGTLVRGAIERIVSRADGLFVAGRGTHISHHGGHAGFVTLAGPGVLRMPAAAGDRPDDLLGRSGNQGRAGICIPDFDHGQVLQLTGHARSHDPGAGGTQEYWEFAVERWILRDMPRALAWEAA